jgi:thioredoxin reductase
MEVQDIHKILIVGSGPTGCKIGGGFLYLSRTGIRKEKFYDESQVGIRLIIALAAKGK